MSKSLKSRLAAGEAVHGLLSPNVEATTLETLGLVGFSHYILDAEHGPAGPPEAADAARACEIAGMTLLVSPRGLDPKLILQYLDAGAMGIMLPGVRETDDVRRLVEAMKYPPKGLRGIAAVRANRWTLGPEKIEDYVDARERRDARPPADRDARGRREADRDREGPGRGRLHHRPPRPLDGDGLPERAGAAGGRGRRRPDHEDRPRRGALRRDRRGDRRPGEGADGQGPPHPPALA